MRWRLLGLGAVLLVVALCGVGWCAARVYFPPATVARFKPMWMLRAELAGADPVVATYAVNEIEGRIIPTGTALAERTAAIDAVLARHAKPSLEWTDQMTDAVRRLRGAGAMTDVQWRRYLDNTIADVDLVIRTEVQRGTTGVPVTVRFRHRGAYPDLRLSFGVGLARDASDARFVARSSRFAFAHPAAPAGPRDWTAQIHWKLAELSGEQEMLAIIVLDVDDPKDPPKRSPIELKRLVKPVRLTLHDALPLEPVAEPALHPRIASQVRLCAELKYLNDKRYPKMLYAAAEIPDAPTDLALTLYVIGNGHEYAVASGSAKGGQNLLIRNTIPAPNFVEAKTVRIELRSDADVARGSANILRYWSGQIAYPEVPLQVSKAGEPDSFAHPAMAKFQFERNGGTTTSLKTVPATAPAE